MNLGELLYEGLEPEKEERSKPTRELVPLKDRELLHRMSNGLYCVFGSGMRYECDECFHIVEQSNGPVKQSGHSLESECCHCEGGYYGILNGHLHKCEDGEIETLHDVPEGMFLISKHGELFGVTENAAVYALCPLRLLAIPRHGACVRQIYGSQYVMECKSSRVSFCKVRISDVGTDISKVRLEPCRDAFIAFEDLCLCRGKFGCGSVLRVISTGECWSGHVEIDQFEVLRVLVATPHGFSFGEGFTAMFPGYTAENRQNSDDETSEVVEQDDT